MLVKQKILKRSEQESAQAAFLVIGPAQRVLFQQMGEKSLDKILCFGRSVTAVSQKGIERRPVRLAEIRKRLSALMYRTEFVGRAGQGSIASFETQLLRSAMFQVSVS